MGKYVDFVIPFDPKKDTEESMAKKLLYSLYIRRQKFNKPTSTFIAGQSGEGKSWGLLKIQEMLLEMQGLELKDYVDDVNIFTPLEYGIKVNRLLGLESYDKNLKKINVLGIHEARELVNAKQWQSFANQAISDVNALSRTIKRLIVFMISQNLKDVSTSIRVLINYYVKAYRPLGKKTQFQYNVTWIDDRDLDNIKLRKRPLRGYKVLPSGMAIPWHPKYLEISRPSKEVIDIFEKKDFESKASIIKRKMERLIEELKIDNENLYAKVDAMIKFYTENPDRLQMVAEYKYKKWKLKDEAKLMHQLTNEEMKVFQSKLDDFYKKPVIEPTENDVLAEHLEEIDPSIRGEENV